MLRTRWEISPTNNMCAHSVMIILLSCCEDLRTRDKHIHYLPLTDYISQCIGPSFGTQWRKKKLMGFIYSFMSTEGIVSCFV